MLLDFDSYIINEASLKKLKRQVHGSLDMGARKRMRKELRNNIITFKFRKRNGELRTAHGTLHPGYLPRLRGGGPRPERQMVYYDLDKEAWRSFRSYSFIKILNIKPVDPDAIPDRRKEDEEEEARKKAAAKAKEAEEKEMEKEVHAEEKEEKKKKVREIDDEIVDDDDKKSVLDDKDTPEEEELVKKEKEEEKEKEKEKEKGKEKDKEKDNDKESEDE